MKLISLNIWGGHEFNSLVSFIITHAKTTDVFCLQEAYSFLQPMVSRGTRMNVFEEVGRILPDHQSLFVPIQDNIDEDGAVDIPAKFGQAIFVRRTLSVEREGFVFVYRNRNMMEGDDFGTLGNGFQYVQIKNNETPLMILSVHGISLPGHKLDTPDRLAQSQKIRDFLSGFDGKKIVCGDFNLMPDTESIKLLERDMKNLIKEFKISNTRGELHAQKYPNDTSLQRFADYIFVSPGIKVVSFEVPNVSISDHLPLILEFL